MLNTLGLMHHSVLKYWIFFKDFDAMQILKVNTLYTRHSIEQSDIKHMV
jgi:hypothetical protein